MPLSSHSCSPPPQLVAPASLAVALHSGGGGVDGEAVGSPSPRVQTPTSLPSPPPLPPQRTAYVCRLLMHNFSVFLFCSSVLHLHPCRYCSFVLSPHHLHLEPTPPPTRPARLCVVYLPYVGPAVSAKENPHPETARGQFHQPQKKNKRKNFRSGKTPKSDVAL